MLSTVAAWLVLFVFCVGNGAVVARLLLPRGAAAASIEQLKLWRLHWIGFTAIIAVLQLLSLLVPLNGYVLTALALSGAAGVALLARSARRTWRLSWSASLVLRLVAMAAVALLIAHSA